VNRLVIAGLLGLSLAACSSSPMDDAPGSDARRSDARRIDARRIVSLDLGSADTLLALGEGERLVGLPGGNLPEYLQPAAAQRSAVGSIKTPDLAAVAAARPDLILLTGRQGESRAELEAVAPVQDVSLFAGEYQAEFERNVRRLGALSGREAEAEAALAELAGEIERQRRQVADSGLRTLVLTHNGGRFSVTEQALVYQVLQAPRALPAPPPLVRGAPRVRPQPLALEALAATAPEVIFIIDRSAAIGDAPLDLASLAQTPLATTPALRNGRLVYLDPALWYLSGGGLQSMALQLQEAAAAYR